MGWRYLSDPLEKSMEEHPHFLHSICLSSSRQLCWFLEAPGYATISENDEGSNSSLVHRYLPHLTILLEGVIIEPEKP
jgi:hypothetical protein